MSEDFFPCERLSLPVSNNADKYFKLSQPFCSGQFFYSLFFLPFGNFWVQLIETDSTGETVMDCGMKEQAKVHIISSLLFYLLSLSPTSTHCRLFPASAPTAGTCCAGFVFLSWVCVFVTAEMGGLDEGSLGANHLFSPQLPLATRRLKLQTT